MVVMSRKRTNVEAGRRSMMGHCCRGFTLLEVMIALAILAIALTSLFGSQSSSLSLAIEARFNTAATLLAREKLAEYSSGVIEAVSGEGDFGERFPGLTWAAEVEDANIEPLHAAGAETGLKRVELTIRWENEQYSATFTEYLREVAP